MKDKKRRVRIMLDKKISEKKSNWIKNEVSECQHAYAWPVCVYARSLHAYAY